MDFDDVGLDYVPGMVDVPMDTTSVVIPTNQAEVPVQSSPPLLRAPQGGSLGNMGPRDHKYIEAPGLDVMPGAIVPMQAAGLGFHDPSRFVQFPEYYPNRPMAEYSVNGVGELTEEQKKARMNVGITILTVGLGAALGYTYGKAYGALAGALFGGAAVNAYRTYANVVKGSDTGDKEAKVAGTYAVATAALGGYLWYKLVDKKSKMTPNPDSSDAADEDDEEEATGDTSQAPCQIRKAE